MALKRSEKEKKEEDDWKEVDPNSWWRKQKAIQYFVWTILVFIFIKGCGLGW